MLRTLLIGACGLLVLACGPKPSRWVLYYGADAPPESFADYSLIVLDTDYRSPIRPLLRPGRTVLGYVSLGQAESHRGYFAKVKQAGLLLGPAARWPGSFNVDIRDYRWTNVIIEERIPAVLARGFDGVFLDTLDSAIHLEHSDPHTYGGMTAAAGYLVRVIRERFPHIKIMLNRSYTLLPVVDRYVDFLLGESTYAGYDFVHKRYIRRPRAEHDREAKLLAEAKQRRPHLQIMTLDYWEPDDRDFIERIYSSQRALGFVPYVATIKLNHIVPEP